MWSLIPKNTKLLLEKIKSTDPCCLPPFKATLQQKIKRSSYVALFLRNSTMAILPDVLPEAAGRGWELDGETLSVLLYEGPHTPALFK